MWEPQISNDGKELTRNFNQKKKKSDVLQWLTGVQSVTNVAGESISSIIMWIIVNQIGKLDFSCGCGSIVNKLNDRKLFFDQINTNHWNPIPTRRDWNCSTMWNLRCLHSAANEMIQ